MIRYIAWVSTIGITLTAALASGLLLFLSTHYTIDFSRLAYYNPGRPSVLLDDAGQEWARFQLDKRDPVSLDDMPSHLIHAFLAAEDWNFFAHHGISYKGIIRSLLVNIYYGSRVQGASTITQQLVKLLFLSSSKTFSRKIKEQIYALILEKQFTKEQILQTYLNHIYFGCGIYGVEAASQRFWGKSAAHLAIHEAALLASVVCSPGRYCPLLYPLSAQKRRNTILHTMKKLGFITNTQLDEAVGVPVTVIPDSTYICCAPHVRESLRTFLEKKVGKTNLYNGGFVICTTLNKKMQEDAQRIFSHHTLKLRASLLPEIDGALISIDKSSGQIKALVGGVDFAVSKFNRALQSRRQIGSTIKPLIYALAIKKGKQFCDTQLDEPLELVYQGRTWRPKNYNRKYKGRITLAEALSYSSNMVAIHTLLEVGAQGVVHLLQACGIQGSLHEYPSLALGTIDATLKEVIGMFNIFANDGVYVEPYLITAIKNSDGKKIWRYEQTPKRILDSHIIGQVMFVLQHSLQRMYSYYPKHILPCQAISKTGTTNHSRSCWYVGSTPDYTTGIYIGCDDNRSMGKKVFPVGTALPIWLDFQKTLPVKNTIFTYDPSLQRHIINSKNGEPVATLSAPNAIEILR